MLPDRVNIVAPRQDLPIKRFFLVSNYICSVFRHASVSSTYPGKSASDTFGFSFCQRLVKRRDDIVVADMVPDMVADMKVDTGHGGRHGGGHG